MSSNRKGLKNIRTLRGQANKFRARTPQGALIELAQLAQKKARLRDEMERWQERIGQIQSKLRELDKTEKWLYRFVDASGGAPPGPSSRDKRSSPGVSPGFREVNVRY